MNFYHETFVIAALPIIILDILTVCGIKRLCPKFASRHRRGIRYAFIFQSILSISILIVGYFYHRQIVNYRLFAWYYYFFGGIVALYIPKTIFVLFLIFDRILAAFSKLYRRWFDKFPRGSRRIFSRIGVWTSIIFACVILWGILFGRNMIRVDHVEILVDDLPNAFHGYKIVQISDIHAGSFARSTKYFQKAVDLINRQEANLIVFTGDMVNNFADEITPLIPVFSQLKVPDGKYAVLGNHDYGGYSDWNHPDDSIANHEALINAIGQMGFTLLNNKSAVISRYNSDRMALIGIENWGMKKRFPKQGNLEKAMEPIRDISLKVLLAHDPSVWHEQVEGKTNIVLTLSGHTHGMQMGMKLKGKYFGPASLIRFDHLAGLYQTDKQYLYVNRGLGVIGFPGRIGMLPEITVISLWKAKSPEQE